MRVAEPRAAILLAAGMMFACTVPFANAAAQARMQTAQIIDQNGFAQPMVAATMAIPEGWRSSGTVRWQPLAPCQADATQMQFTAQDESGLHAVEIIPGTGWQANNLPVAQTGAGCPFLTITSAQQYLAALVQHVRPGATILDFRPRPDLIKTPRPQLPPLPGTEQRQITEGGEVLIGYEMHGRPMREVIQAVVDVLVTRMPGINPGEAYESLYGSAGAAFAMRAPEGSLNFATANAIQASFALHPAWHAEMLKHQNVMMSANAKGARDRSEITARTAREVNDIMNKGWQERQAAQDRMHERTIRTIRETELFAKPGGTVELPGIQNRAWQTDRGNYITSDQNSFDPNRDLGIGATELRRID